jgi:hypothetical protein
MSAPVVRAAPALTLTGTAPDAVPVGTRVVAEWTVANNGPLPLTVNVYVRAAGAPIAGLCCRNGRTSVGRYHGSAVVPLEAGGRGTVVALLGPVARDVVFRAVAVADADPIEAALTIAVR